MRRLLKSELNRSIWNRNMLLALSIGVGIGIWHVCQVVIPLSKLLMSSLNYKNSVDYCPQSLFYSWLGGNTYPMQSYLYFLILPILASLPYGSSFFEDRKSGYIKSIYIRADKRKYLFSKYIAVFVSGGIAVVLPLIVNLAVSGLFLPDLIPESYGNATLNPTSFLYKLYYTHPWRYIVVFLVIDFIFAGLFAGISLTVSFFVEYRFFTVIASFFIYIFIYSVCSLTEHTQYAPNFFLNPANNENRGISYIVGAIVLFFLSFVTFYEKGVREDAY